MIVALAASVYAAGALVLGLGRGRAGALAQGRSAVTLAAAALALASTLLVVALARSDFRFAYVAEHTSRAIPVAYKVAAFWAGQEGSFLLWSLVLGLLCLYVSTVTWRQAPGLAARALVIMLAVNVFFLFLLVAVANPFRLSSPVPADGQGLNPMLQNFGMLAHPLALYLGYVGFTVPFAFALAEMFGGRKPASRKGTLAPAKGAPARAEPTWLDLTRSFTLFSWLFLSIGILLGMQWAYVELGWGGYWSWDPVENASLLPWLTATAFLHSALVRERKNALARWNALLVSTTFFLTLLGTYLTRTGVVSSVHAFAPSGLEVYFVPFLALVAAGSAFGIARAWRRLGAPLAASPGGSLSSASGSPSRGPSGGPGGGTLSREAVVAVAVMVFAAMTLVVLWGTLYPLVARLSGGREVAVGASYYGRAALPVGAAAVSLLGLCQAMGWGQTSLATLGRRLVLPFGLALAGSLALAWVLGSGRLSGVAAAGFGVAFAVLASGVAAVGRDVKARAASTGEGLLRALSTLVEVAPRRYGAALVHLAVALMVLGFAGTAFRQEQTVTMRPDETATVAGYDVTFRGLAADHLPYRVGVVARLEVERGSRVVLVEPQKQYYSNYEAPFSEVAVVGGLREDFYAVLDAWTPEGAASVRVVREPLVAWIWIGGYLLVGGTLMLAWPRLLGLGNVASARSRKGGRGA